MSHDIPKLFTPHRTRIDLSNEPSTNAVQSTVQLQHVWLICVTHAHYYGITALTYQVHVKINTLNLLISSMMMMHT